MEKFFKYLYGIISSRIFKFCLVIAILSMLVLPHFKKEQINVEQIEKIIARIKDDRNTVRYLNNKNKVFETENIKKEIVPENKKIDNEKKLEEEKKDAENLKKVTNIFLKFKLLEDIYQNRLKNKKINYKKVAKYGDFVYYESVIDFNKPEIDKPTMHFFLKLEKGDFISEKLIGKKVNEYSNYAQMELVDSLPGEAGREAREKIKAKMLEAENKGIPIISSNIIYRIRILDFIPKDVADSLTLEEN